MLSMSPSARYTTQQSIWSVQIGKNLTDRIIAKRQREGYYSNGISKANFKNEVAKRRRISRIDILNQF